MRRHSRFIQVQALLGMLPALAASLLGGGCLQPTPESSRGSSERSLSDEACGLPVDQKASLMPRVRFENAIQVNIDDRFSPPEREAVFSALDEWNATLQRVANQRPLRGVVLKVQSGETPSRVDDCDYQGGDGASFFVVKEDSPEKWKGFGLRSTNPGVTLRCRVGQELTRQVVLIHSRYTHPMQFKSIALHETGHALGLDHTCQMTANRYDYARCSSLSDEHPYRQAVMFPSLQMEGLRDTHPERREVPQENDSLRLRCLYGVDGAGGSS